MLKYNTDFVYLILHVRTVEDIIRLDIRGWFRYRSHLQCVTLAVQGIGVNFAFPLAQV